MRISVFGLGYVGAVTAGCLAKQGHEVVGIDISEQKVQAVNEGQSPILEPGLPELLKWAGSEGRLRATVRVEEAMAATDVSLVCVGTPSTIAGTLDLSFVRQVTDQIAGFLRANLKRHTLIYRSTMLPGSTARLVSEAAEDLVTDGGLEVLYYPEFLREGSAIEDFLEPSLQVVGTREGGPLQSEMTKLFGRETAVVDWPTAEMVKYACNAFHATKVTFANEIGRLGKQAGIDALAVMRLLCQDRRLNLSAYYLKPGNPFGGSCLPKDVRALNHFGRQHNIPLPLIDNLLPSNEHHLRSLLGLIERTGQRRVAILGLAFKPHTDDLRESSMVELAQILLGRGYELSIYDPQLNLASLVGSNKRAIDTKMPHLASLLCGTPADAVGEEGVVVAAQRCASLEELKDCVSGRHTLIDVNGWVELRSLPSRYEGFCW